MKPKPGQPIPQGCAVVTPQCTFGAAESAFRRSLARHVGHVVSLPEIKRYSPRRSNQQNRTVWGFWLPIIIEELGYYPHDSQFVYDQIKVKIGWTEDRVNPATGEVTKVPRPTAGTSKDVYSEFMERFRAFVEDEDSGFGIRLPDPDPLLAKY